MLNLEKGITQMAFKFNTGLKAVIFDFDGTILNSKRDGNFHEVAKLRKLKIPAGERLENHLGMPAKCIIKTFWPEENAEQFLQLWEQLDLSQPSPLITDTLNILNFFQNSLIQMGILSSRRSSSLFPLLRYCQIIEYFNPKLLQAIDTWDYHKPHIKALDNILLRLAELGITKEGILYVGDAVVDWQCASGAGVRFVGVETGVLNRTAWKIRGLESKNIIPDIGWLPVWILKHF